MYASCSVYRAYVWVISRCLVSTEDVPFCARGIHTLGATTETPGRTLQHKPLSTNQGQRVALMNVVSRTAIQGDSINSGHRLSKKRNLLRWMGTSKKKTCDLMMGCANADIPDGNREDLHHQA